VVARARPSLGRPPGAAPPDSTLSLAIGEAASFAEYPLPPRPHTLPPLENRPTPGRAGVVALFGPDTATTATVVLGGAISIGIGVQTPGFVHITIAGLPEHTSKFWVWGVNEVYTEYLNGTPGPVTVTVTTEHLTGDWFVSITELG